MSYHSNITFDGTDLTELPGIHITQVQPDTIPEILLSSGKLARASGIKIYNKEYGGKKVFVDGIITRNNRENALASRALLLKALRGQEVTLQVIIDNLPLEFIATVENVVFQNNFGGYSEFNIEFLCSDSFGYDRDSRTIVNGTNVTTSSQVVTLSETIDGSFETPGYFTVTVSSVVGGSSKYIDLANQSGDNIRVTRDWTNDNQLIVDMRNKLCQVNGVDVDYTGYFWDFDLGDTSFTYSDNFTTSRSAFIAVTYKRRYQ